MTTTNETTAPLLRFTLFSARPAVGGRKLHPLTGGRLAVLEERGNVIATGAKTGDEVDSFTVYEALLVALLDGEELAELSVLEAKEWKIKVRSFAMGVADAELNQFWGIFNAELDAAKAAQVKPRKKPGAVRAK